MKSTKEIKEIIKSILEGSELFLVDVSISADNSLEVYIDSLTGVNVGKCREVCKKLDAQLDRETQAFPITVASAGLGYPFKVAQQYEKNLNKEVEAKLLTGEKIQGILKSYSDEGIVLECEEKVAVEGKKKKSLVKIDKSIQFKDIKEVKDIVIF